MVAHRVTCAALCCRSVLKESAQGDGGDQFFVELREKPDKFGFHADAIGRGYMRLPSAP